MLGYCLGRQFYTSVTSTGGPGVLNNQGVGASSGGKVINTIANLFFCAVLREIGIQIKNIFSFFIFFHVFPNSLYAGEFNSHGEVSLRAGRRGV